MRKGGGMKATKHTRVGAARHQMAQTVSTSNVILLLQSSDSGCGGCYIILLIVVAIVIATYSSSANARNKARRAYDEALRRLKAHPSDPELREEALRLGRHYSNVTRNWRGVTIYDEVALSNDINAACAAASAPRFVAPPSSTQPIEARLNRLQELKSQGLIDEHEYLERRRQILGEI